MFFNFLAEATELLAENQKLKYRLEMLKRSIAEEEEAIALGLKKQSI